MVKNVTSIIYYAKNKDKFQSFGQFIFPTFLLQDAVSIYFQNTKEYSRMAHYFFFPLTPSFFRMIMEYK